MELEAPSAEPLTIDELKLHLRVDASDEDDWLEAKITAARQWAEDFLGFPLTDALYGVTLDEFADDYKLTLPQGFAAVDEVAYLDAANDLHVIAADTYMLDVWNNTVYPVAAWPSVSGRAGSVRLKLRGQYGAEGGPTVPERVKHALLLLIAHWYEQREATVSGPPVTLAPLAVESLLRPLRVRLGMA